jgi:subtilisin family serine protease
MKKFYLALSVCFILLNGSLALALEGVGVMVLDTPVDYLHNLIAPVVDTTAMSRYSFTDVRGHHGSWKELTDLYSEELVSGFEPSALAKLLDFFDHEMDKGRSLKLAEAERQELADFFKAHPEKKGALEQLGTYLHGTHVAGLAVGGLAPSTARLISAPVFSAQGFELQTFLNSGSFSHGSFADILGHLLNVDSERGKLNLASVTRAISEQEIKVVNMSFGRPWHISVEQTLSDLLPLFIENPDTIFVIAAGNDAIDITPFKDASGEVFPKSKIKNVLFVAALDENGELAPFSDYGVGVVNIAAQGTSVVSARPGGGKMHMDGTSMAAPVVTHKVAEVRYEHPELNAPEAIGYLLDHETRRNENLAGKVTGGRYLPLYPNLGYLSPIFYIEETYRLLEELYGDAT